MTQAVSGAVESAPSARTAPLVVQCATWDFAVRYATTPGHLAKPRVAREVTDDGTHWAVFTQVPCGARATGSPAPQDAEPRATGPDAVDFWRLLRAT